MRDYAMSDIVKFIIKELMSKRLGYRDSRPGDERCRTPLKERPMLSRSPIKGRRDCSPCSRSPLKRQTPASDCHQRYIPLDHYFPKSPMRERAPLQERPLANNAYAYEPYSRQVCRTGKQESAAYQRDHGKYNTVVTEPVQRHRPQGNNLQLFGHIVKDIKRELFKADELLKKAVLLSQPKADEPRQAKKKELRDDTHNLYKLQQYKDAHVEAFTRPPEGLRRHWSEKDADVPKTYKARKWKESFANMDQVLMSGSEEEEEEHQPLTMDPFL